MTDAATTASNNGQNQAWTNRFGKLKDVAKRKTSKGTDFVAFTLVGQKKADANGVRESFEVKCITYAAKVMAAALAAGNGANFSVRGVVESYDRSMDGGKYTERTSVFKALMINEPKAKTNAAPAGETAGASTTVEQDLEDQIPF